MRMTMNTMMRRYNSQLSTIMYDTARAQQRVTTGRKYETPSEDPNSAIRAAQMHQQIDRNTDYLRNLRDTLGRFDVAESSMTKISQLTEDAYAELLAAVNGTMGESERGIFAAKLRTMQEQMVMDANVRYGNNYLFGGSSTQEPPYNLENGVLTFRGINVNSTDPDDQAMLQKMADEHLYVDLGFGVKFDGASSEQNTVVRGTAFDTAFPGIDFMGWGEDADGMSNNVVLLLGEVADVLEDPNYDHTMAAPFVDKLLGAHEKLVVNVTELGTDTMFMNFTQQRLEDTQATLEDRAAQTELIDTEYAITMFNMQYNVYMAALKMGPSILTPSFIDFMS